MKQKIIKIATIALVCVTIATTFIITCYADNQVSDWYGNVTETTGIVWLSYGVGINDTSYGRELVYADNINMTPTYMQTYPVNNAGNSVKEIQYYAESNDTEFYSDAFQTYQWTDWQTEEYISPVSEEEKVAYVGMYESNISTPDILLDDAVNDTIDFKISFENIITWDEDYIDVGDKQSTITAVIKVEKNRVNNVDTLILNGALKSEKIGGNEAEVIEDNNWEPNVIDVGTEYWITIDNITRPSKADYEAMYNNSGYFFIRLNTNNGTSAPAITCQSEVIILEDMDKITKKAIEDNIPEAQLIPVADFGSWIANSISGFMNFTIMEGVSIGGIFIMLISFATVMWLLKLFAGG